MDEWGFGDDDTPEPDNSREIQDMLTVCLDNVEGSGLDFIESLSAQFEAKGYLSEAQVMSLEKFYDNLPESVK